MEWVKYTKGISTCRTQSSLVQKCAEVCRSVQKYAEICRNERDVQDLQKPSNFFFFPGPVGVFFLIRLMHPPWVGGGDFIEIGS